MNFAEGLFWFLLGIGLATMFWRSVMRSLVERILEQTTDQLSNDQDCILMRIELVDNMILCYNAESKEFICQGADLSEVMDNFKKRYPNYSGMLTADEKDTPAQEWIRVNRARMKELGQQ